VGKLMGASAFLNLDLSKVGGETIENGK